MVFDVRLPRLSVPFQPSNHVEQHNDDTSHDVSTRAISFVYVFSLSIGRTAHLYPQTMDTVRKMLFVWTVI